MLYSSCTEANMGLFQALLTEEDAVISDTHNHGSSIDGMRLSKARRHRWASYHPLLTSIDILLTGLIDE